MRNAALLALISIASLSAHALDTKASLVDVKAQPAVLARHAELAPVVAKLYRCTSTEMVPAPAGRMEIPHHYLTGSNGPTNPAEHAATEVYTHFEARVTAGADQFLAKGDHKEATCALEQLDAWAKGNALTNYDPKESSQSWFQSEWTLASVGTAMTVLVNDSQLDPAAVKRVVEWMDKATNVLVSHERPGKDNNNHHYWRAQAAAAVGVVANDRRLYEFAVTAYKDAIADIDERGAFPKEMARHENAIHYQAFASQPLVIVAQLAARQGQDLYSYSAHGRTIKDALVFLGKAMADPTLVKPYTDDAQKAGFHAGDVSEVLLYVANKGADGLPSNLLELAKQPSFNSRIGGSMLIFAAR